MTMRSGFTLMEVMLVLAITIYVLSLAFGCLAAIMAMTRCGERQANATVAIAALVPRAILHPQPGRRITGGGTVIETEQGGGVQATVRQWPGYDLADAVILSASMPLPPSAATASDLAAGKLTRLPFPGNLGLDVGSTIGVIDAGGQAVSGTVSSIVTIAGVKRMDLALNPTSATALGTMARVGPAVRVTIPLLPAP